MFPDGVRGDGIKALPSRRASFPPHPCASQVREAMPGALGLRAAPETLWEAGGFGGGRMPPRAGLGLALLMSGELRQGGNPGMLKRRSGLGGRALGVSSAFGSEVSPLRKASCAQAAQLLWTLPAPLAMALVGLSHGRYKKLVQVLKMIVGSGEDG